MAIKHDTIDNGRYAIDLLYPGEEKRKAAAKRKAEIEKLPTDFENDLMLSALAEQLMPHNQYKMVALLTELSTDIEVITYRQEILEDLLNIPQVSATLQKVINTMMTNDKTSIYKLSTPDSFTVLDTAVKAFEAYIECTEMLHKLYLSKGNEVKSEGIKKLFAFFEEKYNGKHFNRLKKETEELRDALAGKIRSATIAVNFDENLTPVSFGLLGYSDKLFEGQGTVFDRIISLGAKNKDNKVMKDLHQRYDERQQTDVQSPQLLIDRAIFKELDNITQKYVKEVDSVMDEYRAIGFEDICSIDYQLQFYMGAVNMIENVRSKGLEMCRPEILPMENRKAEIKGLFDPIYFREANAYNLRNVDKKEVITNDIAFDDESGFYVLTGANNGGKTTFIRAVGICQVMAQAGLYVPAEYAKLSLTDCVYTHFPKEEQVGIDTSRFTTEIKEFKTISDYITKYSLLLMNESIQSTTPSECVEIASQLMRIFCIIGVRGVFATHLNELANSAEKINGEPDIRTKAQSIVVSVNAETGERQYKIRKGLPTATSYAGTIFKKYGLDIEALERKAKQ